MGRQLHVEERQADPVWGKKKGGEGALKVTMAREWMSRIWHLVYVTWSAPVLLASPALAPVQFCQHTRIKW